MCEFERLNEISKNAWNAKQPANAWNPLTYTINATIPTGLDGFSCAYAHFWSLFSYLNVSTFCIL